MQCVLYRCTFLSIFLLFFLVLAASAATFSRFGFNIIVKKKALTGFMEDAILADPLA